MVHLQVPAIDEACQPPTTSAAVAAAAAAPTLRKRKRNPETQVASSKRGSDGTGGPSPAQTRSPPTGGGSRGVYDLSPAEARTKIRDALPEESLDKWARSVSGPSWRNTPRPVTEADLRRHAEISRLKAEVTGRGVPDVAAVVGKRPLQEGVALWPLGAKSLNFPVNDNHLMGGPVKYEGKDGAVAWRKNVRWPDQDGHPLPDQCATAHYVYEVVDRCALDGVLIVDASGVGPPRGGSGLVRGDAGTKHLMKQHIRCLLEGGARIIEVHSARATEHFIDALEETAAGGSHDVRVTLGSSSVRAHIFFDVPCGGGQGSDTVVVIGTNHHCMMRTPLNAARIVRHQIFASALGERQLDTEQVEGLWGMVAGATMTNEEWTENYATLQEELNPEERAVFERFLEEHAGDMNSAWASLVGHRGATADLKPKTLAHPAHQRTAAAGKTPLRFNVDKTAAERGSTKSTNGAKADGARTATVNGAKVTVPEAVWQGSQAPTADQSAAMLQRHEDSASGGEDGVHKGTEGGTGSGYKGAGKKNAELTLGDVMRKPEGLNPGFKELRCLHGAGKQGGQEGEGKKGGQEGEGKKGGQEGEGKKGGQEGAGKKGGRCEHITDWDGRGIPDLRPTAAPGTWVAVVGQHMIRKWVEGGKVKTLHNGGLSPWKGDATTGRSLKGAKGVDYLTEWQAREAVKKHSSLYQEWLKNNPNN